MTHVTNAHTNVLNALSTVGTMYVIQEKEAPCISISDTNSNHKLEKLMGRIKYVAQSCKEIRDKYHVYDGTIFSIYFYYLKHQTFICIYLTQKYFCSIRWPVLSDLIKRDPLPDVL